jgi:alpha-glucosidase
MTRSNWQLRQKINKTSADRSLREPFMKRRLSPRGAAERLLLSGAFVAMCGVLVALSGVFASLAAHAADIVRVDRYQLDRNGVTLQISALRDDIIRIRAGRGGLPEDASWAVPPAVRSRTQAMELSQTPTGVELRTRDLRVLIVRASLRLRIEDTQGHLVLDDAPGEALVFDRGIHLRKAMPLDAHYFGLGDKTGPLDRRGESFVLWNTDAGGFGESTDPVYKSIPFVLGVDETGRSFGLLFDNTWRSYFDFGKTERDTLAFGADAGPVDYYVMAAAEPKAVVQAYAYLTGAAPLAPLWSLGFQQSRYSYENESQARAVVDRLRADHIPADVLYLDIDYQDHNRPFTVSAEAFPDLPRLIADLESKDLRVVLITDLHIARLPDQGYRPYDTGVANDVFLKRPDGSPYVAEVWPGPAVFPDFSRERVRDWWGGLYADFVRSGVAGFWNDMNEPAIFNVREKTMPLDIVHRIEEAGFQSRDASHAEMHNVYGMLNSRATYEGLLRLAPDRRPFVLTRASFAGGQRYSATWTGDNTSSWNHLRLSVAMLNNLGVSGFAYCGDDIGGFEGAGPSPELLTRWFEIGAFNPIFRDHATKGKAAQEHWIGGADQESIRKRYIEERYRLMPYLYALAEENSHTGLPLMRPVFLEFPEQLAKGDKLGGTADQFMLGPDLLIAPASAGESPYPYTIALPGVGWYDYWTGLPVRATAITETPRLDRLPVFVRPGAILPRQPLIQSTRQTPVGPLELSVYPGPDCAGQLYLDDGVSFGYRRGVYLRQTIRCLAEMQSTVVEFDARVGPYQPWWRQIEVLVHGWPAAPRRVTLGHVVVPSHYDAAAQTLHIMLPDIVKSERLRIEEGR